MPEGHTLFALARDLDEAFAGTRPRVSSPQGRFTDGAALLDGTTMLRAIARGKHLLCEFEGDRWLNVHLGLIGKFAVTRFAEPLPRTAWDAVPVTGQVRLRLINENWLADLRGATRCALITPQEVHAITDRLGPDPLQDKEFDPRSWQRVQRSNRTVAELLMDQSIIAGVGNVYRCEILYRHRVKPLIPGRQVHPRTWQAMWNDLRELMPIGVQVGQIITMDDQLAHVRAELEGGRTPSVPREYYVYRRAGEPCWVCGNRIRTQLIAQRNLFWCGTCQRRH